MFAPSSGGWRTPAKEWLGVELRVEKANVPHAQERPDGAAAHAPRSATPLLTHREASALLEAIRRCQPSAVVSLDLGRSEAVVRIEEGAAQIGAAPVSKDALAKIAGDRNKCFHVVDGELRPVALLSTTTGWARSLLPTDDAPTTLVAGFNMHRIRATSPLADTRAKVRALGRGRGRVLDTATGLGYTAIELARAGREVLTVELDPAAIELARCNPWSQELFASSAIALVIGDVAEVIAGLATGAFAAVLHDPPALPLAGALYSRAFYRELCRVLQSGGRLFHYVGDPRSGAGGRTTTGVMRRLAEAGFENVRRHAPACGVTAVAGRGGKTRLR